MNLGDEPVLGNEIRESGEVEAQTRERIRSLLDRERFAVLCTQGEGQPYGSLIALTVDETLRTAVFATSRATRKYRLLSSCDRVAFLVDDRDRHPDELMSVEAVTATGRAREISDSGERARWSELLLAGHPDFGEFLAAPSTALFCIDVVRYLHVGRFQEVRQWLPPSRE